MMMIWVVEEAIDWLLEFEFVVHWFPFFVCLLLLLLLQSMVFFFPSCLVRFPNFTQWWLNVQSLVACKFEKKQALARDQSQANKYNKSIKWLLCYHFRFKCWIKYWNTTIVWLFVPRDSNWNKSFQSWSNHTCHHLLLHQLPHIFNNNKWLLYWIVTSHKWCLWYASYSFWGILEQHRSIE